MTPTGEGAYRFVTKDQVDAVWEIAEHPYSALLELTNRLLRERDAAFEVAALMVVHYGEDSKENAIEHARAEALKLLTPTEAPR